jgi:hypothetical protein
MLDPLIVFGTARQRVAITKLGVWSWSVVGLAGIRLDLLHEIKYSLLKRIYRLSGA